jgi:hypothetical protein
MPARKNDEKTANHTGVTCTMPKEIEAAKRHLFASGDYSIAPSPTA